MDSANPIGEIKQDSAIQNYITILCADWDKTHPPIRWWQRWKRPSFTKATAFVLLALDDLVAYADEAIDTTGADKKATVLWAIRKIFQYVGKGALPVCLRPFAPQIMEIIIFGIISPFIDWMIDKYRNGAWKKQKASELAALWEKQAPLAAAQLACRKAK